MVLERRPVLGHQGLARAPGVRGAWQRVAGRVCGSTSCRLPLVVCAEEVLPVDGFGPAGEIVPADAREPAVEAGDVDVVLIGLEALERGGDVVASPVPDLFDG